MRLPTYISAHWIFLSSFPINTCASVALVCLSFICLNISSYPSLSIETTSTNTNGAIAVTGLKGDNFGIDYTIAVTKK